jgi:nitrous oxide reductase accessory protein NosL
MRVARRFLLIAVVLAGIAFCPAPGASAGPSALGETSADKCPVCGMFVSRYPDWVARVELSSGQTRFFDGCKDMFRYLANPSAHEPSGAQGLDPAELLVLDYYALAPVNARDAWFVIGSDVLGPMGHELIPFASEAAAREFMADHKGQRILRYGDVTPEILKGLK